MAWPCLFTSNWTFAVILKRNIKPQVLKYYAQIHKNTSLEQHEAIMEEHSSESNGEDNSEEIKSEIMKAGLKFVPEHGWSEMSLAYGAKSLGLSSAAHRLIQGGGPGFVHYFNFSCNLELERYLKEVSSANEKVDLQVFIADALEHRLKMIIPYVSKWPEAMALMALPPQIPEHTKNVLHLVDSIWHFYGDESVDMSWYGKRLALAVAYKAAELSLIQDKSSDFTDTINFVQRRVANVIEAENVIHMINENRKHLFEFGEGAFTTVKNLLGLNRWHS